MQGEVVPFPRSAARQARVATMVKEEDAQAAPSSFPPRPGGVANPRREYRFADVVRLLCLHGEPRTMISYLRDLALQAGMPLPRNPRRHGGRLQTGADRIGSRSRWCSLEFDAWLDGHGAPPPAARGAVDARGTVPVPPPVPAPVRQDMANRARALAAGAR